MPPVKEQDNGSSEEDPIPSSFKNLRRLDIACVSASHNSSPSLYFQCEYVVMQMKKSDRTTTGRNILTSRQMCYYSLRHKKIIVHQMK